jgi:3-hydroxyisobutyrate dehydrogenase
MQIGIAGFGRMGAPMAARLMAAGHQISVWNRSSGPAAAADRIGARVVGTPAELIGTCQIVLTSLFDETAVRSVYLGAHGLLSRPLSHQLFIETSTLPPVVGHELAQAAAAAGGWFVDAPVLGSVKAAREGSLIALAGGEPEQVERARPILAELARAVHRLGGNGTGYAGKLAINLLKGTYWAALGDCMALAQRFGIEPSTILDIVESGPGASVELALKLPVLRGEITEPAFDIDGCQKDLRAIVAAGGGPDQVPVAAGALLAVERAVAGGWAKRDVAAVALFAADRHSKQSEVDTVAVQ